MQMFCWVRNETSATGLHVALCTMHSTALASLAQSSGRLMCPPKMRSSRVTACLHIYLYPYRPICQYLTIKSSLMNASCIQLCIRWLPGMWLLGSVATSVCLDFFFYPNYITSICRGGLFSNSFAMSLCIFQYS